MTTKSQERQSRYELLIAALVYMDQNGILKNILDTCQHFKNNLFYSFDIEINPLELLNQNAYLGNLLLNSQKDVALLFHEVIYHFISIKNDFQIKISPNQMSVVLHLLSIPNIPSVYNIQNFNDLVKIPELSQLICLKGIVIGMTAVSNYSLYTMYLCPVKTCKGSQSKEYIRTHVPGALETETIKINFNCIYCNSVLNEVKSCRTFGEKVIVDVLPSNAFTFLNAERYQTIPVYVRGTLSKNVTLGSEYQFLGIICKDFVGNKISCTLEANNVIPLTQSYQNISQLSPTLEKLFTKTHPWKFALSLSYYFANEITPPGTYWKLKLCILLNLVSSSTAYNLSPLHLLVIGKETSIISKLLLHSLVYWPKVIKHNACNYLTGKVCKDFHGTSPYYVKAGSLILASTGICYFGDISGYKKPFRDRLQSVIMSNRIPIEIESKFTESLPNILNYPLNCQLWAYCDPKSTTQKHMSDELLVKCNPEDFSKSFLDAFGILIHTDDPQTSSENDEVISSHLLSIAMNSQDTNLSLFDKELFDLLKSLQNWQVDLTKKSKTMIEQYYLASRRITSYNMDESRVPVTAIEVITKLSISFTKLSLRHEVTKWDVLMAIRLYEETLLNRFGISVFNVSISSQVLLQNLELFLKYNDEVMEKFLISFNRFNQQLNHFDE